MLLAAIALGSIWMSGVHWEARPKFVGKFPAGEPNHALTLLATIESRPEYTAAVHFVRFLDKRVQPYPDIPFKSFNPYVSWGPDDKSLLLLTEDALIWLELREGRFARVAKAPLIAESAQIMQTGSGGALIVVNTPFTRWVGVPDSKTPGELQLLWFGRDGKLSMLARAKMSYSSSSEPWILGGRAAIAGSDKWLDAKLGATPRADADRDPEIAIYDGVSNVLPNGDYVFVHSGIESANQGEVFLWTGNTAVLRNLFNGSKLKIRLPRKNRIKGVWFLKPGLLAIGYDLEPSDEEIRVYDWRR